MTQLAVGFTQRVQLAWLEWAAELAVSKVPPPEAREELQVRLRPLVSVGGDDNRSNRGKVMGILMKTWVTPSSSLTALHADALSLFQVVPKEQHLALHWGMVMATYPYFGTVVDAVGRLLALQETVSITQVARRVEEVYGQRRSIKRGTQRAFYTLYDWGVIAKTEQHSIYGPVPRVKIYDSKLASWLIEAALISRNAQSIPWSAALQQPALFPFSMTDGGVDLNGRLEVLHQGLDNDVIVRRPA